jgi:DNA/RNA endonuclease G (NUC1)
MRLPFSSSSTMVLPALLLAFTACADTGTTTPLSPAPASATAAATAPPPIVISQIYGGGGNTGATLTHDFVELFNPGNSPVSVAGWSVQYASAGGSTWNVTALSGTIEPGRYYLVRQAAGSGGSQPLPTPDASGSASMAATAGKVALRSSTTALSGTCPTNADIVNMVGFGSTASCGGTTPNLGNTTAAHRKELGCAYTGVTFDDFQVAAPSPRNSAAPAHVCGSDPGGEPEPELPAVRFSEIHYDNVGTDVGEFLEIEGPAGTDLTGWSVVLYNGTGGAVYDTRVLSGSIPAMCSGRGVVVLAYEQDGLQNGSPDGMALVNASGELVEFLSYEGTFAATDGPAAGITATAIPVSQSSAPHFQTLQRRPNGVWEGPVASTRGDCHGSTPVTPVNQISFGGRSPFDAPLPVGFEDQLFADLRAPSNATVPTTVTWVALTPDVATIDARGVMRALTAGTATFRATAHDGTTNTFSLPMVVASASTTAAYGNHAEFGEPADGDASDDYILRRIEFTTSFNPVKNIPNWVSYNLEATHITEGQDRCDCFTYDPLLPPGFQRYNTADYTGAGAAAGYGIDRGHLARSFDRTAGALDNARTFYFSNIIPQAADNNQGPWARFESHLGALAQSGEHELYIVTGASGSKGTVKNEGVITIPSHVWKVAVIMPRDRGMAHVDSHDDLQVIAVIMPNDPGIRNVPWETYRTTVNAVEALSGYDVLALLPDAVEALHETGLVEAQLLIDALRTAGTMGEGEASSLSAHLAAAAASLERGNRMAAAGQLRAFRNEVDAMQRSGRLSMSDATALRAAAQGVMQ